MSVNRLTYSTQRRYDTRSRQFYNEERRRFDVYIAQQLFDVGLAFGPNRQWLASVYPEFVARRVYPIMRLVRNFVRRKIGHIQSLPPDAKVLRSTTGIRRTGGIAYRTAQWEYDRARLYPDVALQYRP
jgi:hypothetical protein